MLAPVGNQTVTAGSTKVLQLSSTDQDNNARTFSLDAAAPAWADLVDHGDGTATLSLSPATADIGTHGLTVTVSDGDLQDAETISVQVIQGIALRASAAGTNTGTTSLVLAKPIGTTTNDVLVAAVTVRGVPTITPPLGWTAVRTDTRGTALRQAVFVHVAGVSEPTSYTWTFSQAQTAVGTIAAYSGVDTSHPIDAHNGLASTASATITAPSVTTTMANTQLVAFFGIAGKTTVSAPSGMTELREVVTPNGAGRKVTAALDDELRLPVGATSARLSTAGSSGNNIGQLVALRPTTGSPPPNSAPTADAVSLTTAQDSPVLVTLSARMPRHAS